MTLVEPATLVAPVEVVDLTVTIEAVEVAGWVEVRLAAVPPNPEPEAGGTGEGGLATCVATPAGAAVAAAGMEVAGKAVGATEVTEALA